VYESPRAVGNINMYILHDPYFTSRRDNKVHRPLVCAVMKRSTCWCSDCP
jgi:hypothetical protein